MNNEFLFAIFDLSKNIKHIKMKTKFNYLILFVIIIIATLISCEKKIDIEKEKQSLLKTDIEFSKYSEKYGQIKSFLHYADEKATIFRPNSMPIVSKKEIEKLYHAKCDTSFTLTWNPLFAEVSQSSDIGYTYGLWQLKEKNEFGKEISDEGTYVTIWKKQSDSTWKWTLDIGNKGLKKPVENFKE